jgi:hypothetical protein
LRVTSRGLGDVYKRQVFFGAKSANKAGGLGLFRGQISLRRF